MRKLTALLCIIVVMGFGVRAASALPTVEEILRESAKAAETSKTFSSDMTMETAGPPMAMKATGKMIGMRVEKDGKTIQKTYQTMKTTGTAPNGQRMTMDQKIVNDGTWIWMEMRHPAMPMPMVTKRRATGEGDMATNDPVAQLEKFKEMYHLQITGEEKADGVNCYVIEGTFNKEYLEKNPDARANQDMMNKMKMHIGSDDMFPRKIEGTSPQGEQTMVVTFTNVKLNARVDEALFKYTPPPGARVVEDDGAYR